MYQPPNALPETLLLLLDVVAGWAFEYLKLIVLGDFHVHANDATSSQAVDLVSSIAELRLSQIVSAPMHQAGHVLYLIFVAGFSVDLKLIDRVPW